MMNTNSSSLNRYQTRITPALYRGASRLLFCLFLIRIRLLIGDSFRSKISS